MSVSYEKLPGTKCQHEHIPEDHQVRSSSKGALKPFLTGLALVVGALMVAAVVVIFVHHHHHHHQSPCENVAGSTTTHSSADPAALTDLLPYNGSCVCTKRGSDTRNGGSSSLNCYTFLGEIVMKIRTAWLKVKSIDTMQVSWIQFSQVDIVPQTTCERMRSSKIASGSDPAGSLKFAPGIVSQQCLQCICLTESMCKPVGCHWDVSSLSCGYFQIKYNYWLDCGKPGSDWKTCANDLNCSSTCVQAYMQRYAVYYKCPLNCEGFAREHNGGPKGCFNPKTLPYWEKVKDHNGCHNLSKSVYPA